MARDAMSVPTGRAEEETGPAVVLAAVDHAAAAGEVGLGREPTLPEPRKKKDGAQSGPENYKVLRRLGGNAADSPSASRVAWDLILVKSRPPTLFRFIYLLYLLSLTSIAKLLNLIIFL